MSTVYIGIGSNIGNRKNNCMEAIRLLEKNGIRVSKQSVMHETEPWGVKDQPRFINMAVEAETDKDPEDLLAMLENIEKELGRTKSVEWGPRIIDLDILLYDDLIIKTPGLSIPHPLMLERGFVLIPLCEIAPNKKHPVAGKTVKEICEALKMRIE